LFDRHLRRAAGNPVNHRGETFLAVRQHIVVGGQLRAAEVDAVEDVAVGVAVAERQARAQNDIPLKPADVLPLILIGR
jgi:predicted DNA-binding protein with PD1-like motif